MVKIFFDCEFTGLFKDNNLISIGLISNNNRTFYAEFNDYNKDQLSDWLRNNVINNLIFQAPKLVSEEEHYSATRTKDNLKGNDLYSSYNIEMRGDSAKIKKELLRWLNQFDEIEFVSDVSHYDFVLLIDLLFGNALKMPSNMCADCFNINQLIAEHYNITLKEAFDLSREEIIKKNNISIEGKKHNSLYDAKVIKEIYSICLK